MSDQIQRLIQQLDAAGATGLLLREFYTEGTWTPAFAGTGTAGSFTYAAQYGRYVRVGGLVWVAAYLAIAAIGVAPTVNLQITGLPYAAAAAAAQYSAIALGQYKLDLTAGKLPGAYVAPSATTISLLETQDATAVAFLPAAALQSDSNLILSGIYEATP